jgi:aspartyl-tRNA synthetase
MQNVSVRICGWISEVRDLKKRIFFTVRDHTGVLQCIIEKSNNKILSEHAAGLALEQIVAVSGTIIQNPHVRQGGCELVVSEIEQISRPLAPLPFDLYAQEFPSLDIRMDWRFLDLRRPKNLLIFKIQTAAEMAMREYWIKNGFIEIHSPKLMGSPSESGSELFELNYFGGKAYLAQSPQFYKQMAMAAGFDRVFEIGPVFRANPSFTSRHDTEFTSVDVEVAWVESHHDVMAIEEKWIQYILSSLKDRFSDEIREHYGREIVVPTLPFPRVTMEEAKKILKERYSKTSEAVDLDPQDERLLADYVQKTLRHEFIFITDYPISVRPFYHMRYPDKPMITKSFDLLWNGLEITTGAQREHRYEELKRQAFEKGLTEDGLGSYLQFFKYGCPPHGGYGFGLTRMLMILLGLGNVREVTFIYRGPKRLFP